MITAFFILIGATLVSFMGSLQLGPVNLFVIDAVLFNGRKTALGIAIGGSIPELLYCALAVYLNAHLMKFDLLLIIFKIVVIVLLIILAGIYFVKKGSQLKPAKIHDTKPGYTQTIYKGFILALFNPQLLPFWMFVHLYFNSTHYLKMETLFQQSLFVIGAGLGAFLLLNTFIVVIHKHKLKILRYVNNNYYYKIVSILLFSLALHQLFSFNKTL